MKRKTKKWFIPLIIGFSLGFIIGLINFIASMTSFENFLLILFFSTIIGIIGIPFGFLLTWLYKKDKFLSILTAIFVFNTSLGIFYINELGLLGIGLLTILPLPIYWLIAWRMGTLKKLKKLKIIWYILATVLTIILGFLFIMGWAWSQH